MSYFCRYYAVQEGIKLKPDPETKKILFSEMDKLELQKKNLGSKLDVGRDYVINFGLHIFKAADDEDRSGNASKNTAFNFVAASQFLEVAKQFGELPSDISEKIKYAKWKAADISKALKQGLKPKPGGADEQEFVDDEPVNTGSTTPSSSNPPTSTSSSFPDVPQFGNLNVSPPSNPSPTDFTTSPPSKPPHHPNATPTVFTQVSQTPVPQQPSLPTYQQPSQPTYQQPQQQFSRPSSNFTPSPDDVEKATKYTKYVLSSLQFEDIPSAIKYLNEALHFLTGTKLKKKKKKEK